MPQRRRLPPEWERIRDVFRRRRADYPIGEVPALLGIDEATLRQAIEQGKITPLPGDRDARIAWEDVVMLGLDSRWTVRMITEALRGTRVTGDALPPLVRVVSGRVVLPRHQWQILRLLAARRSRSDDRDITVSDLLEDAVSTAVLMLIEDWESIEASLPGVRAAHAWPSTE